ncbi:hypothetical protein OSTOST_19761 [Ostertagia ostertagi]
MDAIENVKVVWGEGTALERTFITGSRDDSLEDKERAGRSSLVQHDVLLKTVEIDRRKLLRKFHNYCCSP